MHLSEFSKANRERCESQQGFKYPIDSWSLSDWFMAVLGELGEAANIGKKLLRIRDGIPGNTPEETEEALKAALAKELADVQSYLDLLAQRAGVSLETATIKKWNEVSARIGYPGLIWDDDFNMPLSSPALSRGDDLADLMRNKIANDLVAGGWNELIAGDLPCPPSLRVPPSAKQ